MKQLFKILGLGICIVISLSLATLAQDTNNKNKFYGGFGYFYAGYEVFSLQKMNDAFIANGYPEVSNGSTSLGGGGHYVMNNWLLGGEGAGLLGGTVENSNYKVIHAGGYGFFNVGYMAVRTSSFMLYPMLGLGGGNLTLYINDKSQAVGSFDDFMKNPAKESIISTGGFLLNFSFMANYIIIDTKENDQSGGFIVGLKAGYILNTSGNNWVFSGETISNTPAAGMSGPYVSIVIGGGGIGINK